MYLLMLLVSAAHCRILVHIHPETRDQNASIATYGTERSPVTDLELKTFELTPPEVKCWLYRAGKTPPDYVYVKKASKYGYRDMYTNLRVTAAKIVGIDKKEVILFYKEFINNSSTPATVRLAIKEDVLERMNIRWFPNKPVSVGRELVVNFSPRMNITTSWDREEKEVKLKRLAPASDVEFTLQPAQNATVTMKAVRAKLDVSVEYVASLSGDIFCQYTFMMIPINWKTYDVNDFLRLVRWVSVITSVQYIFLDYHYDGQVLVEDGRTGDLLLDAIDVD